MTLLEEGTQLLLAALAVGVVVGLFARFTQVRG